MSQDPILPMGNQRAADRETAQTPIRRGKRPTLKHPLPPNIPLSFNPMLKLEDVEKFWILSAISYYKTVLRASRAIGMAKETMYRKLRMYGSHK